VFIFITARNKKTLVKDELALAVDPFAVRPIGYDQVVLLHLNVHLAIKVGEAPLVGRYNLLAARELVLGTTERLEDSWTGAILAADGQEDLADGYASNDSLRLAEGSTHSRLQTISTSA